MAKIMTTRGSRYTLVLTFGQGRPLADEARLLLPVIVAAVAVFAVYGYLTGQSLSFSLEGWSVGSAAIWLTVLGFIGWTLLKSNHATVEVDDRHNSVTLERRYVLKTMKQRFKFEEIERFEAERLDLDGTPAVQPRLVLKNGTSIDLGSPEVGRIGETEAAIAKAQGMLLPKSA